GRRVVRAVQLAAQASWRRRAQRLPDRRRNRCVRRRVPHVGGDHPQAKSSRAADLTGIRGPLSCVPIPPGGSAVLVRSVPLEGGACPRPEAADAAVAETVVTSVVEPAVDSVVDSTALGTLLDAAPRAGLDLPCRSDDA